MCSMICLFIVAVCPSIIISARLIRSHNDMTKELIDIVDERRSEPWGTIDNVRKPVAIVEIIEDSFIGKTKDIIGYGDTGEDIDFGNTKQNIDFDQTREDIGFGETRDVDFGEANEDIDVGNKKHFDIVDTKDDSVKAINQLIDRVNGMEETIKLLRSTVHKLQLMQKAHKKVIFHAVLDHLVYPHLTMPPERVIFGTVMLNIGEGYNDRSGMFVAPVSGMYIFSVSILSDNGPLTSFFEAELLKNGIVLAKLYGHGVDEYHDQGSATVVTHLQESEHVWIRLICCGLDSLYGGRFSTFSGALLS